MSLGGGWQRRVSDLIHDLDSVVADTVYQSGREVIRVVSTTVVGANFDAAPTGICPVRRRRSTPLTRATRSRRTCQCAAQDREDPRWVRCFPGRATALAKGRDGAGPDQLRSSWKRFSDRRGHGHRGGRRSYLVIHSRASFATIHRPILISARPFRNDQVCVANFRIPSG